MIERVENRGLEEPLELEGNEDEFSKCRKSKIKYTRALLLELTDVEVCRKLPSDFDLLVLRQLDEGSEARVELKSIFGKPFDHGPFLRTTWNLPFRDQRRDDHLYTQSKESHLQSNCSSERKEVCQPLPQKPEEDAGVLHCKIQKCDIFQLSKTENPYRPPHLNKKMVQPLATFSEPGVESLGESDGKGSADDIAGHEQSGYGSILAGADDSIKEPVHKSELFRRNNEENEVIEPSKPLDDYEDFWRENEENVVIGANNIHVALMEDNQPTFDDFWVEILETIHLQQEPGSISPRNNHADSDVEIHFPDEESLTSVGLDNINKFYLDASNDVEAEISLPDEDNLISIYDMIVPCSNSGSWEANKVPPNIAIDIRNNSNSAKVAKRGDRSKRLHLNAQRHPDLLELLPRSQTSMDLLCDQAGFPPLFSTPDIISYIPSLNSFAQSDIHLPHPNTKTDNSISQYSLSQQPNIFPQRQNHLLLSDPMNLLTVYDLHAMQFLRSTSKTSNLEGFGKSEAGK